MTTNVISRPEPRLTTRREALALVVGRVPRWVDSVAVGAAGIWISLWHSGTVSVWLDEAATISASSRSLEEIAALVQRTDLVHAAYYLLVHGWGELFGYSAVSLRGLSGIAVGVTAAMVVLLGQLLGSRLLGVLAGVVFLSLPVVSWMALEARSSALATALTSIAVVLALLASRLRGPKGAAAWAGYWIVTLLAVSVFVYSVFVFLALGVALTISRVYRGARDTWALASATLCTVVALYLFALQAQSGQVGWLAPVGPSTVSGILVTQWFREQFWYAALAWAVLVTGLVFVFVRLRREWNIPAEDRALWRRARGVGPVVLSLSWIIVPVVALLALSVWVQPLYHPRYLAITAPAVALLLASVLIHARGKSVGTKIAAVLGLAVLLALGTRGYLDERLPWGKDGTNWAAAAESIAASAQPGDGVVYASRDGESARALAIAYPEQFAGLVDVGALRSPVADASLWGTERPWSELTSKPGRVWLVQLAPYSAPEQFPGSYTLASTEETGHVQLSLFVLDQ